jgi:ParB family transcriptional regulator, chromosome partitioning protein
MTTQAASIQSSVPQFQERRLGRTILRTYRTTVDLYDVLPHPSQPRLGPKEDPELQRQIEAKPHPEHPGTFRIIDGDRRWTNSKILVEVDKKDLYRRLPAEVTDRTLSEDERLRAWIYIHRQRKEWDTKEKEMVAYRLVDLVGRASAANILGITVRELDKLVEIYELSEKLTNLPDPATSITWAREIKNLNRRLLTPQVIDTVVKRVNDQKITNSKELRKLRLVLKDPVARDEFLTDSGSIDSALLRLGPALSRRRQGLAGDIEALAETIKGYSWTALAGLKGDMDLVRTLEDTEKLLKDLRRTLSKS